MSISKVDRINNSINNMDAAIKYYLKDARGKYLSRKMTKNEYIKLSDELNAVRDILKSLKLEKECDTTKLDEIRLLHLGITPYYEDGDNNLMFCELTRTNNILCNSEKNKDKKSLENLKKSFKRLSNFYQYRLRKAEIREDGIGFKDKKFDNFQSITEHFLVTKYNFKRIKFDTKNISGLNQKYIDECTRIIESKEIDDSVKEKYSIIREYVIKYSQAELVIENLEKIKKLCDSEEYQNIREKAQVFIDKYKSIYEQNKKKAELREYSNLLHSVDFSKIGVEENKGLDPIVQDEIVKRLKK